MALFADKYYQTTDVHGSLLGQGGASVGVERCFSRATNQEFAVKRLSPDHNIRFPYLMGNETHGLIDVKHSATPRIVEYIELTSATTGEAYIILELINGSSLDKLLKGQGFSTQSPPDLQQHEQKVMEIAAQMLQTVHLLHTDCNLAHLDITSSNIMLRHDDYQPWDQLRLVDFGFAQKCNPGRYVFDVIPQGATAAYASPELLESLQMQFVGEDCPSALQINGVAADWWSTGVVLYELLTGELPFNGKDSPAPDKVPEYVASHCLAQWQEYERMMSAQDSWLAAASVAIRDGSAVQHPMMDKVRQCSANPDEAARFFQTILSPYPENRVKVLEMSWCAKVVKRMFKQTGTDYKAGVGILMARKRLQARQRQKPSLCAALCGCFGTSRSPSREDDTCPPPKAMSGGAGSSLADGSKLDIVASSASEAHDHHPETEALAVNGLQQPAALTLSQRCFRKMKKVCRLKSKHKGSATAQKSVSGLQQEQIKSGSSAAVAFPEDFSARTKSGSSATPSAAVASEEYTTRTKSGSSATPSAAVAFPEDYTTRTKSGSSATLSAAVASPEESTARSKEGQPVLQPGVFNVAASARSNDLLVESQQLQSGAAPCNEEVEQLNADRVDPRRTGLKSMLLKGNRLAKRLLKRSG